MDDIDVNKYCGKFEYVSFDDLIPKGDFARFVVLIVDSLLKTFNLENELFHHPLLNLPLPPLLSKVSPILNLAPISTFNSISC